MPSLWKFSGLTPLKLVQLDYQHAQFLVSLIGMLAGAGSQLQERIVSSLDRLAPGSASDLVRNVVYQTFKSSSGIKLAAGILGALWAASSGMSAVVVSLNKIYQVLETRLWWKQKITIVGLTIALAALIIIALALTLYGGKIGEAIFAHIGAGDAFRTSWKVLQWPVSFGAMYLAFSTIYYFAPDIQERRWYWVTPGSVAGVGLWLLASLGFRLYLHFFNSYSATYGSLGRLSF
jgi:membrane protein